MVELPGGGFNAPPKPTPSHKPSPAPHGPILPVIKGYADQAMMPEDEPMRIIILSMATKLDRLEELQKSFGPDAGKLAAQEAARVLSAWIPRIAWRMDWIRWSAVSLTAGTFFGLGMYIGINANIATPFGAVSPEVASIMRMQNWNEQLAACRYQPSSGGIEWCMMPIIRRVNMIDR